MMNKQLSIISGTPLDAVILSTDQKYLEGRLPQVGTRVEFDDGRVFRFCSTAEVFVAGEMVAVQTCQATEIDGGITAAAVGTKTLTIATTAITFFGGAAGVVAADRLSGGYLMITDDTGEGYSYRIKSNTAGTAAVALTVTLYDGLKVAVAADTDCIIVGPKYRKVTEGAVALSPIGACLVPTTGASSTVEAFFWVQTRGPAVCLGAGTVGVEIASAASGAVADAAEAGSGVYDRILGTGLGTTANGYAAVDLRLE